MTDPTPIDLTTLIRRYCDGELDADQIAAIDQRIASEPDLAERVRVERASRAMIARTLESMHDAPPADLAPRIRQAMAKAESSAAAPDAGPSADTAADEASPVVSTARRSWLVGPQRANIFAVAATIAVIAGAVLFGIYGRPIDSVRNSAVGPVTEIAQFASGEHSRCAGDADARGRKATWREPGAAAAALRASLGCEVPIFDLGPYRFLGAGECHVPGAARSAHLVYARDEPGRDGCPSALVSLFVMPSGSGGVAGLGAGEHWTWTRIGDQPECRKVVACSADGSLTYLLVCCNDAEVPLLAEQISRAGKAWRP